MTFTKRLSDGVRRGEITCSVRIWTRPHAKVAFHYSSVMEVWSVTPDGPGPQLGRTPGGACDRANSIRLTRPFPSLSIRLNTFSTRMILFAMSDWP